MCGETLEMIMFERVFCLVYLLYPPLYEKHEDRMRNIAGEFDTGFCSHPLSFVDTALWSPGLGGGMIILESGSGNH
jgi:hypothetical protein